MLFKHKCNLQTPASLLWQAAQAFSWHLQLNLAWPLFMQGARAIALQLLHLFHSFLPPVGKDGRVSLTSVILSKTIPKVPVTLALANELCIYFGCKIQGFLFRTSWKREFLAGFSHSILLWNVVFVTNAKEKLFLASQLAGDIKTYFI